MTRILPNLALSLSLATGLIAGTSTAFAETESLMTVTVPFSFTANDVSFPAGTYSVRSSDKFVKLTNISTDKTAAVIARGGDGTYNNGPSRLTFRQHDGQAYLAQVWTEGSSLHSELIVHLKHNREIGRATLPDKTFEIATK
jgi:hypothetical protein